MSEGSRGLSLTDSSVETLLMMATRLIGSVPSSEARVRLTRLAICCAAWIARGSNSRARKVCTQANTPPARSRASRKKVRQNRLRATNFFGARAFGGLSRSEIVVRVPGRFDERIAT